MTSYRHIIWDWNGTLFDDAWLCVELINGLLARREMPAVTRERYQREFTFPVKDYYRAIGFDFTREPFEVLAAEFVEGYDRRRFECSLQPAVRQVLAALAAKGHLQSVLSAYEQTRLQEMVGHFQLDGFFTRLVGLSDYYANGKVDHGRRLIEVMACPLREVVLVGDTLHDYEVAQAMGIDCVLISSGHADLARLQTSGAPVLPSLEALLE